MNAFQPETAFIVVFIVLAVNVASLLAWLIWRSGERREKALDVYGSPPEDNDRVR